MESGKLNVFHMQKDAIRFDVNRGNTILFSTSIVCFSLKS